MVLERVRTMVANTEEFKDTEVGKALIAGDMNKAIELCGRLPPPILITSYKPKEVRK